MSDILEQKQKLEQLMLSEDLEELNNRTNQFNVFNALKLQNNEIRHSNFLGWLMTPYENHELGDYFLKEFLKSAIKNFSSSEKTEIDLKDVAFANFSDAEIRREYKNIDILVISPQNKFLCVVENKIWTGEHDNQLSRYADIVDKEFNGYKKLYIFLTPDIDIECDLIKRDINSSKSVHYIPMCYRQVYEVINKVLKFKSKHLNNEVRIFIEHYNKMIERNIMGNTDKEIVNLCRKIYRENKEAIDLIIENNDYKADVLSAMADVIEARTDLQAINRESSGIIALPSDLNNINQLKYGAWTNDIIVYIHFINFSQGHKDACVEILVAPPKTISDNDKKAKLLAKIEEKTGLKFKGKEWNYTRPFSIITHEQCLNYDNYEEIKKHIEQRMEELKATYIDNLRAALNEI